MPSRQPAGRRRYKNQPTTDVRIFPALRASSVKPEQAAPLFDSGNLSSFRSTRADEGVRPYLGCGGCG